MPGWSTAPNTGFFSEHAPVVVEDLRERLVRTPAHAVLVERGADLVERVRLEPRREQRRDRVTARGTAPLLA